MNVDEQPPRQPQVFRPDDPALVEANPARTPPPGRADDAPLNERFWNRGAPVRDAEARDRIPWGAMLASAVAGLAALAFGVWLSGFVATSLARDDWVGWTAFALVCLAALGAAGLIAREAIGLLRLGQLADIRREAQRALDERDVKAEQSVIRRLVDLLAARADCAWHVARFREHERDVHDVGDLARLADREIVTPIDALARRSVLVSAKRIGMVTALSPAASLSVLFVLYENLRLLRLIAGHYGGRPGFAGSLRLARMVVTHIIASGGLALTDDLVGQFLGQDLLRRLSRRLGEGAFNAALTARIGAAAIQVCRPLPFVGPPVRARDIVAELFRGSPRARPGSPGG